jgi:mycofactocin precursor
MPANPQDAVTPAANEDETTLTAESLIEEVSIDGMCGVY